MTTSSRHVSQLVRDPDLFDGPLARPLAVTNSGSTRVFQRPRARRARRGSRHRTPPRRSSEKLAVRSWKSTPSSALHCDLVHTALRTLELVAWDVVVRSTQRTRTAVAAGTRGGRPGGAGGAASGIHRRGRTRCSRRTRRWRDRTTRPRAAPPRRWPRRAGRIPVSPAPACGLELRRRHVDADRPGAALAQARPRRTRCRSRARRRRARPRSPSAPTSDSGTSKTPQRSRPRAHARARRASVYSSFDFVQTLEVARA